MTTTGTKIESIAHLRQLADANNDAVEVVLALNGGAFTRRTLHLCGDGWDVFYGVSDSWEEYPTDDALAEGDPMIVEGIEKGALWTAST